MLNFDRVTFKFKVKSDFFFRKFEYQSGGYSTFNIEYHYGRDAKFKLRNESLSIEYQSG